MKTCYVVKLLDIFSLYPIRSIHSPKGIRERTFSIMGFCHKK
jgi:hypothetical protein